MSDTPQMLVMRPPSTRMTEAVTQEAWRLAGLLPRPLRALRAAMPEIEFFVLPGTSSELYQKLAEDVIDVALIVRLPFDLPKTLEWHGVRSEPMMLLAPSAWEGQSVETLLSSRPFIRYHRNN